MIMPPTLSATLPRVRDAIVVDVLGQNNQVGSCEAMRSNWRANRPWIKIDLGSHSTMYGECGLNDRVRLRMSVGTGIGDV